MTPVVSGRYRGQAGAWTLDLRVDVDGGLPAALVTGELSSDGQLDGSVRATCARLSGHIITAALEELTNPRVRLPLGNTLVLRFDPETNRLEVPLVIAGQPVTFVCPRVSPFFREFTIELGCTNDLSDEPFVREFAAAAFPPIACAYAAAGIGLRLEMASEPVRVPHGQENGWSTEGLSVALGAHFVPKPDRVWLLLASRHEDANLFGIAVGRRSCAVFVEALQHRPLSGRVFTCVHEIGHCLDLTHPKGAAELTWMNVPARYEQSTQRDFFSDFDSSFTLPEILQLRHSPLRLPQKDAQFRLTHEAEQNADSPDRHPELKGM